MSKKMHARIIFTPRRPTGDPTIAIECTLPSLTNLERNNQPTMATQEDVAGNGGASKVGKGR